MSGKAASVHYHPHSDRPQAKGRSSRSSRARAIQAIMNETQKAQAALEALGIGVVAEIATESSNPNPLGPEGETS